MADTIASILVKLGIDGDDLSRGLDTFAGKLEDFGSRALKAGAILTAEVTAPLALLGKTAFSASMEMDSLMKALATVSGGAGGAATEFAKLKDVAKLPGLGLQEAVEGFVRLRAAGIDAETARGALMGFGNALASVGKGKAELDGVLLALSQIASKGKVSAEEINQIAERVPQIRGLMTKAFGTADTEALQKMGIDSETFIKKMVEMALGLEKVMSGTRTEVENFQDVWFQSMAKIGDAIAPIVTQALPSLTSAIEGIASGFSALPGSVQATIIVVAALAAALGPALAGIGGLALAVSNIIPLIGSAGLAAAFSALSGAVVLASGAVFGFGIGSWAYNNIPGVKALGDALADTVGQWIGLQALVNRMTGATAATNTAKQTNDFANDALYNRLRARGVVVQQNEGESDTDYARRLREAAKGAQGPLVKPAAGGGGRPPGVGGDGPEVYKTFGKAVRELSGDYAVLIEMEKIEMQQKTQAVHKLAEMRLGVDNLSKSYREFMKTWTPEVQARELDALSASINSGVDVKDYNKHLLSSVPGMSGLFIDPTNVKVMENMLKVQIASRDAFKEQDKAAKQYADDERTLGISRINTIREMQDAYSALHLEQERGSVREVKARENILRAMVQEGQALSSAQARWLVYRDIVQDSATNMLRFWQNIRGAVEDAFGSISGVSADVIFGGDPGGASQKLGKAAKEAEEYYKNTLKAAEANAKNSPEVQAAYNAMIAAQQRLNNLSANAPSNTRKRLEEDLKIAAKRHEQLLESATQAAQTADSVTAAYERMLKAQERAADPTFWDRLGAGMKEAFTGIGKDLLQTLFDTLLNPLKQGLSNVLFGGKDGKGGLLGGVLGGIGGLFGGGNGGGGGALPGITNHAASLALGGLGKIGSSAASSATGMIGGLAGMANPIGAIGGAVGAVSSVISNFQMAGMNKSLDIIVKHTLQTVMIGEATFYLIENRLTSIHDRLASMLNDHMWRLHDIWDQLSQINLKMGGGAALAGAGGPALTALVLNEYDKERLLDELANLLKSRGQ
jgi:tape measure domain-containing protein